MGSADKFCLRWNDFESNISAAFRDLRNDADFFDVTLASEDDRQIQAHKLILSACSPFFRRILKRHGRPGAAPILYLKGVRYADLVCVLNFMYHGEVSVAQEELNAFLAVAEELCVKGLTSSRGNKYSSTASKVRSRPPPTQSGSQPKRAKRIKEKEDHDKPDEDETRSDPVAIKAEPKVLTEEAEVEGPGEAEMEDEGSFADETFEFDEEFNNRDGDFNVNTEDVEQTGLTGANKGGELVDLGRVYM